jgi:HEAT repeat protein
MFRVYVGRSAASSRSLLISKHITTILNCWRDAVVGILTMESPEELIEERKPTSLLVAQFFLFPLIIIAICVGIFLLFGYLTYEQRSPREYLNAIQSGSESQRWQAAYELSNQVSSQKEKLDPEFVGDMIAAYRNVKNGDARVRRYLALAIGHIGDKRAVPSLVEGLDDTDIENQIYTLSALGFIGDNSAVPGVVKQLKHPDPSVRKVAAYVLGAMNDPRAAHDLQVALNDVKDEVRWSAAMALARMNDSAGADILVKLLDRGYVDSIPDMTSAQKVELVVNAVKCLALLKFEPAHEKIVELSRSDPSLAVRDAGLEALKKF